MEESKTKWNKLASENAAYYIMTDKSKSDTEEKFRLSGQEDIQKLFITDPIISGVIERGNAVAVEIGCGTGRLSEFIAPHVERLYAFDISEEMIRQAQERLRSQENIVFMATDGMHYPMADSTADTVFSYIVFQHMPTVEVIKENVGEISRVLKTGGVAKIQLRGVPTSKKNWYYGPSFNLHEVESLIEGTHLRIIQSEGEGTKNFWVWLSKTE